MIDIKHKHYYIAQVSTAKTNFLSANKYKNPFRELTNSKLLFLTSAKLHILKAQKLLFWQLTSINFIILDSCHKNYHFDSWQSQKNYYFWHLPSTKQQICIGAKDENYHFWELSSTKTTIFNGVMENYFLKHLKNIVFDSCQSKTLLFWQHTNTKTSILTAILLV